jgi:hypothetical protein
MPILISLIEDDQMSMTALLKGLSSPDLPAGEPSLPEYPRCCWIVLHADIGLPSSGAAADVFTFYVTTPEFVNSELCTQQFQLGKSMIIVKEFSWGDVRAAIVAVLAKCSGDTWDAIATQIGGYAEYEYA